MIESVVIGVRLPPQVLEKVEKYKGYHTRNRFLLKLIDEGLAREEKEMESMIMNAKASGEQN